MIQLDGIGKEIIDKESNGTLGPPIQMSFLGYSIILERGAKALLFFMGFFTSWMFFVTMSSKKMGEKDG